MTYHYNYEVDIIKNTKFCYLCASVIQANGIPNADLGYRSRTLTKREGMKQMAEMKTFK
jgi:hypothetical protein